MMNRSREILKSVFGYDEFRPLQADIIESVLGKKRSEEHTSELQSH